MSVLPGVGRREIEQAGQILIVLALGAMLHAMRWASLLLL